MWRYYPYRNTRIPLEQYTAEGGYYYNFFSDPGKNVFLNIGASGLMGYETVNGGKGLLFDGAVLKKHESFIYGGAVILEAETYLQTRSSCYCVFVNVFFGGVPQSTSIPNMVWE